MELPVPATLEHNGKTYRVPPLPLARLVEHAKWLRDAIITEAKGQLDGLDADLKKHLLDTARAEANAIQIGTAHYNKAALSFNGMVYAVWLALQADNKGITLDEVWEIGKSNGQKFFDVAADTLGF